MSVGAPTIISYQDHRQHLADELRLLDMRIRALFETSQSRSHLDGLIITEQQVDDLLSRPGPLDDCDKPDVDAQEFDERITTSVQLTANAGVFLPLPELAVRFGMSRLEQRLLVACVAPELDRKYDKLYGYLHDDVTRRRPSVGLALDLICDRPSEKLAARALFAADAPLIRHAIVELEDSSNPLIARPLQIDQRIVDYLLRIPRRDDRIANRRAFDSVEVPPEIVARIRSFLAKHAPPDSPEHFAALFYLRGRRGVDSRRLAEAACTELGVTLLTVDVEALMKQPESFERNIRLLVREAILTDAAICLEHCDGLLRDDEDRLRCVLELTEGTLTFFTGDAPWRSRDGIASRMLVEIELPLPGFSRRQSAWARQLDGASAEGLDIASLAAQFRFTPGQIERAASEARSRAWWQSPEGARIDMASLQSICRTQSTPNLDSLAKLIRPRRGLAELVLPPDEVRQLREFCAHARHRETVYGDWGFDQKLATGKGLNALFCGTPGAGKTLAAEATANELGLDVYKIDLSQVVSKYIGDTEKRLRQVFDEAEGSNAILFFDEADALFGKRSDVKDAHDRYANIEVGYLLQRMEEYDGISIMATNMRKNLDEAFVRRLQFVIEFPFPEERERAQIWRTHLPPQMPLADDLDLAFLSAAFKLSGGYIRNIIVAAAFQAAAEGSALAMRHIVRAIRREFQKMGRTCTEIEFGRFGGLLREGAT